MRPFTNAALVLRHTRANEQAERRLAQQQHDSHIAGIRRLRASGIEVIEDVDRALRCWLGRVDPRRARSRAAG
jgi:hypothetical protein